MIISASRRTDIPSYYTDWFFNRLREGVVFVRNPFNARQVRAISLSPDDTDCIVFWTKNPEPMLERLHLLKEYHYYFQFTLNPYGRDIETGLPQKEALKDTFKKLSEKIGAYRVIWRYDPILLNSKYGTDYHEENFGKTARALFGFTEKVTISFIDFYKKTAKNITKAGLMQISFEEKNSIAQKFSKIAKEFNLLIDTCAEDIDLSRYGITGACCIDAKLIRRVTGRALDVKKDKNMRPQCGCAASVDIGAYNSCANGCLYCYANYDKESAEQNIKRHNPQSQFLIGETE